MKEKMLFCVATKNYIPVLVYPTEDMDIDEYQLRDALWKDGLNLCEHVGLEKILPKKKGFYVWEGEIVKYYDLNGGYFYWIGEIKKATIENLKEFGFNMEIRG